MPVMLPGIDRDGKEHNVSGRCMNTRKNRVTQCEYILTLCTCWVQFGNRSRDALLHFKFTCSLRTVCSQIHNILITGFIHLYVAAKATVEQLLSKEIRHSYAVSILHIKSFTLTPHHKQPASRVKQLTAC